MNTLIVYNIHVHTNGLGGNLYGALSQNGAQLSQSLLHLGDAGQLSLQSLLLLPETQPSGRVELLQPPVTLSVELQEVRVEPPAQGEINFSHLLVLVFDLIACI